MKSSLKKIYVAITGMLMAVTAQVNGADCCPTTNCEPSCCDNLNGMFTLKAEVLYWRPELCGLQNNFGNTSIATAVSGSLLTTTVTESDVEPCGNWDAGYRLGAEAIVFDCYDLDVDWTHFDGGAHFMDDAQFGHWNIKYEVLDVTIGRRFCVGSCFDVVPFVGVRAAWIRQTLHSHLETAFTTLVGTSTILTDNDAKETISGAGPQIGLNVDWFLGCNFSLYGSFAVVSYYGDVTGKNFDTNTFATTASICNGTQDHCFNNIATDAAVGLRWDTCSCICGYDVNFMLKAGLEQHRIYNFSNFGSTGTLTLDGGIFAAGVGFPW